MKTWVMVVALIMSSFVNAEDGFDDEGFDDEMIEIVMDTTPSAKGALYGSVDFETHYNTGNNKDLSSLKVLTDVIGDYKFDNGNKITGNLKAYRDFIFDTGLNKHTITPESYDNEVNLNELTIEGSINPNLDFKIGRQIVVWGKSDTIRITDVLNPLDNRTPGLVDIKNLRLGKVMSKLDYYFDGLNLSVIALHENRFTKLPAYGSDYKTSVDLPTNIPSNNFSNMGVALSLTGAFESYDLGLYFADTYIDKPYLNGGVLQYDNQSIMLGTAFNQVVGSYLFKGEVAHFDNIIYNTSASNTVSKSRTDVMVGIEYNGIANGSVGYEIALKTIHDYSPLIDNALNGYKPEKEYQQVLRFNQTYLNQALELGIVLSAVGISAQDGGSARVSLSYTLDDQRSISGGVINYIGGDNPAIDSYKDNDRVFAKFSYLF
jgi:hypothetical protein